MKRAICFNELGHEISIECSSDETVDQLLDNYPEYQFRYWEDPGRYYDEHTEHYDPEGDCYV